MTAPPIRALVVEDEPLARLLLRRLLASHEDVLTVVGEAGSLGAADDALRALRPDLVFLDISLPDGSGLHWLAGLVPAPATVFVTAHDDHVLRALDLNALDYVLKPLTAARMDRAVARVLQFLQPHLGDRPDAGATAASPAPADAPPHDRPLTVHDRVFLQQGPSAWFVAVGEIRLLEAHGDSTLVHFGRGRAVAPRSLRSIEARLPPRGFARANRTQIVDIPWIREVHRWFAGRLTVRLDQGIEVVVSRRQARALTSTWQL